MSTEVSALPFGKISGSSFSGQVHEWVSPRYAPANGQICSNGGKRCQPSRDRWEDLKPFIRRVYIDEGKTLHQLAGILRDKHDFYPTEKQLTKRLRDWEFKKNANWKERKTVVENLDHFGVQPKPGQGEKRITRAKLKRWKKELGNYGAMDTALRSYSLLPDVNPVNSPVLPAGNSCASIKNCEKQWPDLSDGPITYHDEFPQQEILREDDKRWHSSCSMLATLSRLFIAMKLQPSADTFAHCLQPAVSAAAKTPSTNYLTRTEIMDLATIEPLKEMNADQGVVFRLERHSDGASPINQVKQYSAFKFSHIDILFPSATQVQPDPLNELYPWPNFPQPVTQDSLSCTTRFVAYRRDVSICKEKFLKLKPFFPETHPAMIILMEKLGYAYYHLGKASQAEHWYRYAVSAREQTGGARSLALLHSWLGLIDAINAQGRYREAQILHQEIQLSISEVVSSDHPLVQKSLQIIAIISGNLGDQEDAETYYRQLVQIRLTLFGPRHSDTLAAMQRLASPLRRQKRYSESEELLSITVELSKSNPGMSDNRKCRGLSSLAKVLYHQGRYTASESLHRTAMELSRSSLGDDHPATLQCGYHLAQTLSSQGRLEEAETLLRTILDRQLLLFGQASPSTIDSMSELAETLERANRREEAIEFHAKAFQGFLEVWGPDHDYTMTACEQLGKCYEKLGRYDAALTLYQSLIEEVETSKAREASKAITIAEIQDWIDRMFNVQAFTGSQCVTD